MIKKSAFRTLILLVILAIASPVLAQDSANYVTNGTFDAMTGDLPTNWGVFSPSGDPPIQYRVEAGVFEFIRPVGNTQAVVLQGTGVALPQFARLEVQIDIGNSSNVRKRVTILIHDGDFSDLQVCTYWLAPNTPLQTRVMRTYTTEAWTNATISIYSASPDGVGYTRIDNVSVKQRPTMPLVGTECYEPGATIPNPALTDEELQAILPELLPTATPGGLPYVAPGVPMEMPLMMTPTAPPPSSNEGSISEGS